jgi:ABC-type polysaccharide/polyol phosphate export permease
LSLLFYLTPVFYDFSAFGPGDRALVAALQLNPLAALLACYRAAMFGGAMPLAALTYVAAWTVGLLALGWRAYRRNAGRVAKEL